MTTDTDTKGTTMRTYTVQDPDGTETTVEALRVRVQAGETLTLEVDDEDSLANPAGGITAGRLVAAFAAGRWASVTETTPASPDTSA